ncbi:amidohydrolase family protein [Methylobacterium terricola]|uniref:amidohydrolase family protein n=1 Tax=Methylobacterium terricola TaxID=2583531 RepID=UPI0014861222|nr:amidohydrolase family protein [Methylobacterium terricola]
MRNLAARHGFDAQGAFHNLALTLADGRIAALGTAAEAEDTVVLPALANAHDHARPLRPSSIGGFNKPLETWLHRLALLAPVDPYLATVAPLARAALGGQGAVMIHHVRPMGLTDYPTEAAAMARAARDVGVRIALGVGLRDRNPLVYGDHGPVLDALAPEARAEIEARFLGPMLPLAEQLARVEAVAEAVGGPMVDVQYAPNGPQWGSDALWEAVAEASARTGRRVTTHLFETQYQRDWADRTYPGGLVRRWREIGLLSPRLTLAHCVHARPDELEMIAEAGCVVAVNTSSNLALRSGIAPVAEMVRRGCRVALGIDGRPSTRTTTPCASCACSGRCMAAGASTPRSPRARPWRWPSRPAASRSARRRAGGSPRGAPPTSWCSTARRSTRTAWRRSIPSICCSPAPPSAMSGS